MTTNHPTPGDELVERAKEIAIAAYERLRPVGGKFWNELDDMTQTLTIVAARDALRTRDEAARSSTTEVERLREALSDMLWAFVDARSAGDSAEALSIQQTDAETQARSALQSKDHSHG